MSVDVRHVRPYSRSAGIVKPQCGLRRTHAPTHKNGPHHLIQGAIVFSEEADCLGWLILDPSFEGGASLDRSSPTKIVGNLDEISCLKCARNVTTHVTNSF